MAKNQKKVVRKVTYIFRPEDGPKQMWKIAGYHREYMRSLKPRPAGTIWADRPLNEQVLGRMYGRHHALTSHGTKAQRLRNKQADIRWEVRFAPNSSVRYANTWSLHRFL